MQLPTGMSRDKFEELFSQYLEAKEDRRTREETERLERTRYLKDLYNSIPPGAVLTLTDKGVQYILDNIGHLNIKERGTIQSRVDILLDIGNTGDSPKIGKVFRWSTIGNLLDKGLITYE